MNLTRILIAGALAVAASGVQAATYTFDFSRQGSNHSSLDVLSNEAPPLSVNIVGRHYSLNNGMYVEGGAIDVDTNAWGLISDNPLDYHTLDSWGKDESMIFTFGGGKEVSLTSVAISWYHGSGDYDLFADGVHVGNTANGSVLPATTANVFAIGTRTIRTCERYRRNGTCKKWNTNNSGIKIKSITVEYDPNGGGAAVVPLPAAGGMLIAALGALGLMRRRNG